MSSNFVSLILLAAAGANQWPGRPVTIAVAPPPIITPIAPRASTPYGNWQVERYGDAVFAFTSNASKSVFGVACGTSCSFYVNFGVSCTHGHSYPALVNSPAGASSMPLRCSVYRGKDGITRYLMIIDDKKITQTLSDQGEIGIAIPLESGRFNVSRFSLQGSLPACSEAADIAVAMEKRGSELKDFTL